MVLDSFIIKSSALGMMLKNCYRTDDLSGVEFPVKVGIEELIVNCLFVCLNLTSVFALFVFLHKWCVHN
jgi:hypothetical protein